MHEPVKLPVLYEDMLGHCIQAYFLRSHLDAVARSNREP
jgi:hypothetical protein